MEKIRSIAFAVVSSLCFIAVLGGITFVGVSDGGEAPRRSELENRNYVEFPKLSKKTILKGKFQKKFENWVADAAPCRDGALLVNAAMQRTSIAIAAFSLGFDVYPTYFNSAHCAVPKDGLVIAQAQRVPQKNEPQKYKAWVKALNEAARKHPDVNFVYDCVARHDQTVHNPTYGLISGDLVTAQWIQDYLLDKLDPHIIAFVDAVESYDEIKDLWINTEEHWSFARAVKSYNKIAERLSLGKHVIEDERVVAKDWYGDYARIALDFDYTDDLVDEDIDYPDLTFYKLGDYGGKTIEMGKREQVRSGAASLGAGDFHCYSRYYGSGNAEVANAGANNGKLALVICDSLSYPLRRVIASQYKRTVFVLPGNYDLKGSFESYMERYRPDDVIIMLHATKYRSIGGHSPEFVGLKQGGDSDE